MKLSNIRIDKPEPLNQFGNDTQYWFGVYTDSGGTEKQPYGFVTTRELEALVVKIQSAIKAGESGELEGEEASAILDDAKREMFGDDADLLDDDMGAK